MLYHWPESLPFLEGVTIDYDAQGRRHIILGARHARTSPPPLLA